MKSAESFCKKAIKMGIEGAKIIDPGSIVTAEWVRMKCQYGCPGFGERLCCPPRTPKPRHGNGQFLKYWTIIVQWST